MGHRSTTAARRLDPRVYQIAVLAALLLYGIVRLDFEIDAGRAAAILLTALSVQYACTRIWRLPRFDPRSALISGLSLCLLLRSNSVWLAAAGAVLAIGSKFLVRIHGKHVFNPTNIALVALLVPDLIWVSPGQWGSAAFFAFLMACLGGLVVNRSERSDVTLAFLASYGALVIGRSGWLDEPLAIPLHRLQSGAMLLFAFFMISDPKTTPDSRAGRVIFAIIVALIGWYIQFGLFRTNGLLWSLSGCSVIVPLIDQLLPAARYSWDRPAHPEPSNGGAHHDAHGVRPRRTHPLLVR